ncbi:MAG: LamG-like jellyroll fold domain-containing protein [Planctomycetota bacterium]
MQLAVDELPAERRAPLMMPLQVDSGPDQLLHGSVQVAIHSPALERWQWSLFRARDKTELRCPAGIVFGQRSWALRIQPNGVPSAWFHTFGTATATRPVRPDAWTHLAMSVGEHGKVDFYLDGEYAGGQHFEKLLPHLADDDFNMAGLRAWPSYCGRLWRPRIHRGALGEADLAPFVAELQDASAVLDSPLSGFWSPRSMPEPLQLDPSIEDRSGNGLPAFTTNVRFEEGPGDLAFALYGDGRIEVPRPPDWPWRRTEANIFSTCYLYQILKMVLRNEGYAHASASESEFMSLKQGNVDQMLAASYYSWAYFRPDRAGRMLEGLTLTRDTLEAAAAACTAAGVPLVVIFVPEKEYVYLDLILDRLEEDVRTRMKPGWHWEALENYCRRLGIATISLGPAFRERARQGQQLYFRMDAHWNAEGHRLAAEVIARGLEELGLLSH